MNTLASLWMGILAALYPETSTQKVLDQTYTCTGLQWTTPAAMGNDGHLHGVAAIDCDVEALSGGGYAELQAHLIDKMQKQATHINSGPIGGSLENLPSQTYDFNMNLNFSGTQVDAHELGTIASDEKTRLISVMKTISISGSSYDAYIKGFDFTLDVRPNATLTKHYGVNLSVSIDVAKPMLIPAATLKAQVVKAVENAVTSYRDTMISDLQNHL